MKKISDCFKCSFENGIISVEARFCNPDDVENGFVIKQDAKLSPGVDVPKDTFEDKGSTHNIFIVEQQQKMKKHLLLLFITEIQKEINQIR